jgi:hypothetical protein
MSRPIDRYRELAAKLRAERDREEPDNDFIDEILDDMYPLWYAMSVEERETIRREAPSSKETP